MKIKSILFLLPVIALSGCSQPEFTLSGENVKLAERKLTEAPLDLVVYPDDRPSVPDGKLVWEKAQCAQCHGQTGTTAVRGSDGRDRRIGDELWARSFKPVDTYLLTTFGKLNVDEGGQVRTISHQPYRDTLTRADLWNLTAYVQSLGRPALTDKEIAELDPVFGSNCAVCHGTKGDGDGPLARNLEPLPANFQKFDRFFNRTDDVLFDHIANGIKWEGMPNFLGKEDKAKGVKFDEAYIKRLVAYVRKFHISNAPTVIVASNTKAEATPGSAKPATKDATSATSTTSQSGAAPSTAAPAASTSDTTKSHR